MKFLWQSIVCYLRSGGHVWEFEALTYCQGKAFMRCIKCGAKTISSKVVIGK
jgi:hypothetical protein